MSISPETKAERIEKKYGDLLIPEQASAFLKCSNRTVTNLCNRGSLKFTNIGTPSRRVPRFSKEDLVAFLEKNPYFMARRGKGRKKAIAA
jgi:excisionase family DNA binding protein